MIRRRHLLVGIGRHDASQEFAVRRFSRNNDLARFRSNVEPKFHLTRLFVWTVTMKTSIRENWSNVRAEPNLSSDRLAGWFSLCFVTKTQCKHASYRPETDQCKSSGSGIAVLTGLTQSREDAKVRKDRNDQLRTHPQREQKWKDILLLDVLFAKLCVFASLRQSKISSHASTSKRREVSSSSCARNF